MARTSARSSGHRAGSSIFLAICNSALANANAGVNAATRVLYAMARNGVAAAARSRARIPSTRRRTSRSSSTIVAGVALALLLGWKWGPLTGVRHDRDCHHGRRDPRLHPRLPRHDLVLLARSARRSSTGSCTCIFPLLGAIAFAFPLYYQYKDCPPTIRSATANWVAIGWIALGLAAHHRPVPTRPEALENADRIFVEDETVGAGGSSGAGRPAEMAVATVDRASSAATRSSGRSGPTSSRCSRSSPARPSRFETNDCFTGQIQSRTTSSPRSTSTRINSATGPGRRRGRRAGRLARRRAPRRAARSSGASRRSSPASAS